MENMTEKTGNYEKELEKYFQLAEQGDATAMKRIAEIYEDEDFNGYDMALSVKWYRKSAEAGNTDAMLELGCAYHYGIGIAQNSE